MANIMDYLDWRGDLTFEQSPFNEVDNLILAQLPYVELDQIVPDVNSNDIVRLKEASRLFFKTHQKEKLLKKVSMTKMAPFVMEKMASTRRFGDVGLFRYVNEINQKEEFQFCAVCVVLPDGSIFVSYSGTDSSIVGWKEDFNMSFLTETPSQIRSVEYLNYFAEERRVPLRIGGHSKGGNLAMYAAMHCDSRLRERILAVYSNDGPGFSGEEIGREGYQCLSDRMCTILPESSIVGMLMEHAGRVIVVRSTSNGVMQHDGMSWEVLGNHFMETNGVSKESIMMERTLTSWILQLEPEEREEFVDTLFGILDTAKIYSTEELARIKWKNVSDLIKAATGLPKESQEMIGNTLKMLWMEATKNRKLARQEKKIKRLEEKKL